MVLLLLKSNPNLIETMRNKIIIACSILFIITIQDVIGQSNSSGHDYNSANIEPCLTGELFTPALMVDTSTYYNSEWLPGDIYLSNGEIVRNKLIRYNGLLDELFWQEPKSKNAIKLDKEAIRQFHYQNLNGDTSICFRKIKVKQSMIADSSEIFCEIVYDGNVSLFIQHTFEIEGKELVYKNNTTFENPIYIARPIYYFINRNHKTFIKKSLNRKSLYDFSPAKKDSIKAFLKANKIRNFTDKSDLIRLAQFFDTI